MQKKWTLNQPKLIIANDKPLTAEQSSLMYAWLSALCIRESDIHFSYDNPDIGFGTSGKISLPAWSDIASDPKLKKEVWQATRHLKNN